MPGWITKRSRYFWLSLAAGIIAALAALPLFTDPLSSKIGGFVFLVVVVTAIVRQAIAIGEGFVQGWREPKHPASR